MHSGETEKAGTGENTGEIDMMAGGRAPQSPELLLIRLHKANLMVIK